MPKPSYWAPDDKLGMTPPKVSALASCFRAERFLPAFLDCCQRQTLGDALEIVLVLNNPSSAEAEYAAAASVDGPVRIKVLETERRESFSRSINRGIDSADGEYLCIWNVDDLRTPNSTALMAQTLDKNPKVDFTYGDFTVVSQWRSTVGPLVVTPPFEAREFTRSMMLGPFFMWRRSASATVWGFDEQLKVGGDFDFAVRLALEGEGQKTEGLLGYYLDEGSGLSTARHGDQRSETALILRRYGSFDKVDLRYLRQSYAYVADAFLSRDDWLSIEVVAPGRLRNRVGKVESMAAVPRTARGILGDLSTRFACGSPVGRNEKF